MSAEYTLLSEGAEPGDELPELPVEGDDLRRWLREVAEQAGTGPAKLCLLAARQGSPAGTAAQDFAEFVALIDSTRFTGKPPGEDSGHGAEGGSVERAESADSVTDSEDASGEVDLMELLGRLDELRRDSEGVVAALEKLSVSASRGEALDPDLLAGLDAYRDGRGRLISAVAAAVPGSCPVDFEALTRTLEVAQEIRAQSAREEEREEAERIVALALEAEELRGQVTMIEVMLASPGNPARPALEEALEKSRARLAEVEALVPAAHPEVAEAGSDDGQTVGEATRPGDDDAGLPNTTVSDEIPNDPIAVEPGQEPRAPEQDEVQPASVPPDIRIAGAVRRLEQDDREDFPEESTRTLESSVDEGRCDVVDADPDSGVDSSLQLSDSDCDPPHAAVPDGIVELVEQRRPLAAAWLARAVEDDGVLARALTFNGFAFACGPGSISPTDALLHGSGLPIDLVADNRLAGVAAVAGAARAGLSAGWTHRPLLEGLLSVLTLDHGWQSLMDEVVDATHHGYIHVAGAGSAGSLSRGELGQRAKDLRRELESSTIKYPRATKVLHRLLRDDGPLGEGLDAVVEWADGSDAAIEDVRRVAGALVVTRARDRLIDEADERVSTPQQRRNAIIAGARMQLVARIEQVADLMSRCLEVTPPSQAASDESVQHRLVAAAQAAHVPASGDAAEAALLDALRLWILDPSRPGPERGRTADELLIGASLPLVDLARDQAGLPLLEGVDSHEIARKLLNPPLGQDLVNAYVAAGNIAAARLACEGRPDLLARVDRDAQGWEQKLDGRSREVDRELARARSAHQMDAVAVSSAEGRLRSVKRYDGDRYDLQLAVLREVSLALATSLGVEAARLRSELEGLDLPEGDNRSARIQGLVDVGDLTTAREYIFMLGRAEELPAIQPAKPSQLEDFLEAASKIEDAELTAAQFYAQLSPDVPASGMALGGLNAWKQLLSNPFRVSRESLARVLRVLGLDVDPAGVKDITERGSSGSKVFLVRAEPLDGSIVPGLGSRAGGEYYVSVVDKDRTDPQQALALVPESRRGLANLLVIPGSLSLPKRRMFLRAARDSRTRALVIDAACVAYMAALSPGSFRALQELTLPFATFPHYTPFVAGDVPEEVFVGRADEAEQIISPTGSLFVYGGRQLGKSALLRHIAATQNDGRSRHAIYVDLKAKMIGEAQDPAHLWVVLLEEFQRAGILGSRVTTGTAKVVTEHTRNWLNEDPTRRLLLLLDEADLFLESEARQRREGNRVARFANISPLKDLMESTNRRFKPVFAGLHQVQRFHEISNTPLAHGGSDILVGPLDPKSALSLVETPMTALGYRFDDRDLISRLLAFANYQASLIQIVCDHLVRQMSARAPRQGQPPFRITDSDVDAVIQDPKVRRHLAERLRLTIALEDRYLVIALVVATLSLENKFMQADEPSEILNWCRYYWPGGFGDMTARDFGLYLEEMEGLGILVRRPDGLIAARSPNVVSMLGTADELAQQLEEGTQRFQLPHDYNPRVSRRTMRRGAADVRSPLTEQDLQVLLPKSKPTTGVNLVVGSHGLGIDEVAWVLEEVAGEREKQVLQLPAEQFSEWVTNSSSPTQRSKERIPIVIATELSSEHLETLLEQAKRTTDRRKDQAIIVVAGPSAAALVIRWTPRVASLTVLERLGDESLRSWSDGPFGPAENRERVLSATSGWPRLVYVAANRSLAGEPMHSVLESLGEFPDSVPAAEEFLADVGAATDVETLKRWADMTEIGEAVDPEVLDSLLYDADRGPATVAECAERLMILGVVSGDPTSMALDPVVHRALNRCNGAALQAP